MGYRIDFAVGQRTMRARVSGRSSLRHARWIAKEIREEAQRAAIRRLLIDVRGLHDRLGTLGTLALDACRAGRVAVVDSRDNEHYHPWSEYAARLRRKDLRYFGDVASALEWLDPAEDG